MYTKKDLINDFIKMELKPTDTVVVHSSYKRIAGEEGIEGGADTIIDAFIEYFGEEGLVVFPALSWKLGYYVDDAGNARTPLEGPAEGYKLYGNEFDVINTPCHDLGIIPELFRKRSGVIRSLCPTSSVCAYGKDAKSFCEGHEKSAALSWNTPWGKLYDRGAKFLFLGTSMACNTFMHVLEDHAGVPGLILPYIWKFTIKDYDGNVFPVEYKRHEPGHNHYYFKIQQELVDNGIAKVEKFGSAECHLVDAIQETDYMMKKFKEIPELFTHEYNLK